MKNFSFILLLAFSLTRCSSVNSSSRQPAQAPNEIKLCANENERMVFERNPQHSKSFNVTYKTLDLTPPDGSLTIMNVGEIGCGIHTNKEGQQILINNHVRFDSLSEKDFYETYNKATTSRTEIYRSPAIEQLHLNFPLKINGVSSVKLYVSFVTASGLNRISHSEFSPEPIKAAQSALRFCASKLGYNLTGCNPKEVVKENLPTTDIEIEPTEIEK